MPRRLVYSVAFACLILASGVSCAKSPDPDKPSPKASASSSPPSHFQGAKSMAIKLTSSAFEEGQRIPKKYTGEGYDVSPPLSWSGVPEEAKELVLICDDPDAPTPEPWVHWIIYKIPANVTSLKEDVPKKTRLTEPPGTLQGKNSWQDKQNIGYRGPMPPPGSGAHRYYFKIYALEAKLAVEAGMDKKSLLRDIEGHVIAEGQLMGTYSR